MFLQLAAVNELDALKLKILLISSKHEECILTSKELKTLQEAVAILEVSASQTCSQERQPCPNLNKQFYDLHHSDGCDADSTCGLAAFNNPNLYGLRPLVQRLFCVPASSAASERLFSQAGLIMRPTRNRLSKDRLSQLVFLKCNMK